LDYFDTIRANTWNGSTPSLFGAPASTWYDYVRATDSVSVHYNADNLPTLFTGMALDINVPPAELIRFQNEITITNDFWSIPGLIHYMTPDTNPHVSLVLTDTIVYWLRQHTGTTGIALTHDNGKLIHISPNPFANDFLISLDANNIRCLDLEIKNILGQNVIEDHSVNLVDRYNKRFDMSAFPSGIYLINVIADGQLVNTKIIKR